jgi:hypothetical protein
MQGTLEQYVQSPLLESLYSPFCGFKTLEVVFDGEMGLKGESPTLPFPISEAAKGVGGTRSKGLCGMRNEHWLGHLIQHLLGVGQHSTTKPQTWKRKQLGSTKERFQSLPGVKIEVPRWKRIRLK